MTEFLTIIAPVVSAFLAGGGVVAYFKYKETKPKNNADVIVTFANGWQNYATKLEQRLDKQDADIARNKDQHTREIEDLKREYEARIVELERTIEETNKQNAEIIAEKDREITSLKNRVASLEDELTKYQKTHS